MKRLSQNCFLLLFLFISTIVNAQTPIINSYPASNNVVFLDFDGHIVEGTSWNSGTAIVCDGSGLNAAQITTIFNRVAEDYRPFTVNITTDSAVYEAAPVDHRMRLVLTTSSSWYGAAGGVAYINSFTWGDNTPCFVFTALLGYNTKNIAEAASHEIGHTLGLRHQSSYDAVCNKTSEYNAGKGAGEIGWAPIMGVGYYQNMTLWNYGANPFGCNAIQDDLSIITGNGNGISYRTDDFDNAITNAAPLTFQNNTLSIGGIIEKPNDLDAFRFEVITASHLKADVNPYSIANGNVGSNIDLEVELIDQAQKVLGVYNPADQLGATIDTLLPAGTYYLRIQGKGNVYAPNYASLGSYNIAASLTPGNTLPVHKLQLRGVTENKQHKLDWEIIADEKVVSQTVEAVTGNGNFQAIASLGANERSFSYLPTAPLTYYRLAVTFDNGRRFYTNSIALRNNNSNAKPYLLGTIVTTTIHVNSGANYNYVIFDQAGRSVSKGRLVTGVNTIPANFSTAGLYIIQYQNNGELFTERFIKQ